MKLKVGDKILVRINPSKWNGGSGEERTQRGEVVSLDPEKVKIRLPEGEEIDVPLERIGEIEILEKTKESIYQKVLKIGLLFMLGLEWIIIMIIGSIGFGILTAGRWLKDRLKRGEKKS